MANYTVSLRRNGREVGSFGPYNTRALAAAEADAIGVNLKRGTTVRMLRNGVYDPGILKAIFMAGGPGSGKSYTAADLFGVPRGLSYVASGSTGLKLVNNDPAFEHFLKKAGVSPSDLATLSPENFKLLTEGADSPRGQGKRVTSKMRESWLNGRLGIVWDGTGDDFVKIKKRRNRLKSLGYDTFMVFINTSLEVAQARNASRPRKLPADLVESIWTDVQANLGAFQGLFGTRNMVIIDKNVFGPPPRKVQQAIDRFLSQPVQNRVGKAWIAHELAKKDRR